MRKLLEIILKKKIREFGPPKLFSVQTMLIIIKAQINLTNEFKYSNYL